MKRPACCVSLALALCGAPAAFGQTRNAERIETELKVALGTREGQTTLGMVQAHNQASRAYAKEIRRVYGILMKGLPKPQRQALEASQTAWLSYLDSQRLVISYIYDADGTIHRVLGMAALKSLLHHRLEEMCEMFLRAGGEDLYSEVAPGPDEWCKEEHRRLNGKDPLADLTGDGK